MVSFPSEQQSAHAPENTKKKEKVRVAWRLIVIARQFKPKTQKTG